MNYYERHLGDYAKDTAHLTMLEHGAYTLLLDRYYSTEKGIPEDQTYRVVRARSKDEKAAVDAVLQEFFTLEDGLWRKSRVEQEIEKAQSKISAARQNGKRGGRPPKPKEETQQKPSGLLLGSENETQSKAHQTPDTRHQTPKEEKQNKAMAIPPWMPVDAWEGFAAMRAKIRKPMTPRAFDLLIAKLDGMRGDGKDIAAILDQSTVNGWQDVFPIKEQSRGAISARAPRSENFGAVDYGTGGRL